MMDIKSNASNVDTWLRGAFILIFGMIFCILLCLIWVLVIFQFVNKLMTGKLNIHIGRFSFKTVNYATQVLAFVTFQSNERPFPFKSLQDTNAVIAAELDSPFGTDDQTEIRNGKKKTVQKKTK